MKKIIVIILFLSLLMYSFHLGLIPAVSGGVDRFIPMFVHLSTIVATLLLIFYSKGWNIGAITKIVVLWTIYTAIMTFVYPNSNLGTSVTLVRTLYWSLSFILLRIATNCGIVDQKLLVKWFFVVYVFTVIGFFVSLTSTTTTFDKEQLIGTNAIYYPFLCFPWLILINKRSMRIASVVVLVICCLVSLKRSVNLALAISLLFYIYFEFVSDKKNKFGKMILVTFVAGGIALYFSTSLLVNNIVTRFENITEDGGSGREGIFERVIERINNSSTYEYFFGHGFNTVIDFIWTSAHNDFLEVFYDFGLIGLIIYCLLHFNLIRRGIYLLRIRSDLFYPFAISYIIFFVMSQVSHLVIYPTYFFTIVAFWAYVESTVYRNSGLKLRQ